MFAAYHDETWSPKPLELTFRDYVLATSSEDDSADLAYWLSRDLSPAPLLPLAVNPSAVDRPTFTRRTARLAPSAWQALCAEAARANSTPSAALLAALGEVLARHAEQPRFTVTVTRFDRLPVHPDVDQVIGDFTAVSLAELDCSASQPFAERARSVLAELAAGADHRTVSGIRVIRELSRRGGPASFPVVFSSALPLNGEAGPEDGEALFGEQVAGVTQTPQVWLDAQVSVENGALVIAFDAVEELFPAGLLDAAFADFHALVEALTTPAAWARTARVSIPGALVPEPPAEPPADPGRIADGFFAQAAAHPERVAIRSADGAVRYGELTGHAQAIAAWLREHGAGRDRLVAVVMHKGPEQVAAVLGVLAAGAAYLPIDAGLPAARIHELLTLGEVDLVLTQPTTASLFEWPNDVRVSAVPDPARPAAPAVALPPAQVGDLAYVIFTSGSTGVPKGVMIDHRGAAQHDRRHQPALRRRPGRPGARGLVAELRPVGLRRLRHARRRRRDRAAGADRRRRDPAHWAELLRRAQRHGLELGAGAHADCSSSTSRDRRAAAIDALRLVMLSGDWIPVDLPDRIRALVPDVAGRQPRRRHRGLDLVDRSTRSARSTRPGRASRTAARMRQPALPRPGRALEPCPAWVPASCTSAASAWRSATGATRSRPPTRFVDPPAHRRAALPHRRPRPAAARRRRSSSSAARTIQVKIQGYRIELGEIEAALRAAGAADAVVVATGTAGDVRLAAFVLRPAAEPAALRTAVAKRLPAYQVPGSVTVLDAWPLTGNGKLDRKALVARAAVDPVATPARSTVDRLDAVLRMVQEVLPGVDAHQDLFAAGATSVDVVRVLNVLDRTFGVRPAIDAVYARPTVAALAELCASAPTPVEVPAVTPAPRYAGEMLTDPVEREAFKARSLGRRPLAGAGVALPGTYAAPTRRSHRRFAAEPATIDQLGNLLAGLRTGSYASAGGSYSVQTYIQVAAGRVAGLDGGSYYHDTKTHRLVPITAVPLDPAHYDPLVNRPVAEQAAFAVHFVVELAAITPLYGLSSVHFATIEAGQMALLLEQAATRNDLGMCQVGAFDDTALAGELHLGGSHQRVHSMLGGPAERDDGELSYAQERFWLTEQFVPGNPAYAIAARLDCSGVPDAAALSAALSDVVARHEPLRTAVVVTDDLARAHVEPAHPLTVPTFDVAKDTVDNLIAEAVRVPFDLARPPLLRAVLYRHSATATVLVLTHHFAADGWSVGVLLAELADRYAAHLAGTAAPVAALPVRYRDLARAERHAVADGSLDAELEHWRATLASAPSTVELPTDRPRPAKASGRGGAVEFTVPEPLADASRALSRRHGTTLYATTLAAFAALLHRYSGETDLVIGTATSRRDQTEAEALVGPLGNNLPLRVPVAPDAPFAALVSTAHQVVRTALAHQAIPFERLVSELAGPRDLSRAPLFTTMVVLHRATPRTMALGDLRTDISSPELGGAKLDLELSVFDSGSGPLGAALEYSADLFDRSTAERIASHLVTLLAAAANHPDTPVGRTRAAAARRAARRRGSAQRHGNPLRTGLPAPAVRGDGRHQPDAVAVVAPDGSTMTYRELDTAANQLAHRLRRHGVGPDVPVGVCLHACADLVTALLATWKAGGAYVPLDPDLPPERLAYMLADAAPAVVVTHTARHVRVPHGDRAGRRAAGARRPSRIQARTAARALDDPRTCSTRPARPARPRA